MFVPEFRPRRDELPIIDCAAGRPSHRTSTLASFQPVFASAERWFLADHDPAQVNEQCAAHIARGLTRRRQRERRPIDADAQRYGCRPSRRAPSDLHLLHRLLRPSASASTPSLFAMAQQLIGMPPPPARCVPARRPDQSARQSSVSCSHERLLPAGGRKPTKTDGALLTREGAPRWVQPVRAFRPAAGGVDCSASRCGRRCRTSNRVTRIEQSCRCSESPQEQAFA